MEIVRPANANAVAEFYWHEIFQEGAIFEVFLEKLKNSIFLKEKVRGKSPALQVLAREPG